MKQILLSVVLVLFFKEGQCIEISPVVMTTAGPVRGKLVYNELLDLYYYSFLGIPYAESPTGDLRFKPPVPKEPWEGIYNATEEGPVCPQQENLYTRDMMDEDCLFINIHVPVQIDYKLPVFLHVHDGQLNAISGNEDKFGSQFLLKKNIIGITINYRLGALGFLSLGIEEASGNAAIKDVILALKWVQENIEMFGGDPTQVTLSGNSAGSALAQYLLLTEKSNGLFRRIIKISGSALSYRFFSLHPVNNALALAKELGLETDDNESALKILREADVFDIIDAIQRMSNTDTRGGVRPFAPFVPSIEIDYPEAVLTEHPKQIVERGIPQNVPILVGINAKEGMKDISTIQNNETLIKLLNESPELCIPSDIEYPYGSNESLILANKLRTYYFGDEGITLENLEAYIDFISDTQFYYGSINFIELHKNHLNSLPVYFYYFDFDGYLNWFKLKNNVSYPGACHTDNIGYLFLTAETKDRIKDADDASLNMLEINLELFTNFIKYGNPTPRGVTSFWPEYWNDHPLHLTLNSEPYVSRRIPAEARYRFWRQIYDDYQQYVEHGGLIEAKPGP